MNRSIAIDWIKALASQVIVLHHFSLYAPMAQELAAAWPALVDAVAGYGRYAVQSFLVVAGFLAAKSLSRRAELPVLALIRARYLRLACPLVLALLLVVAATLALRAPLAGQDWVSDPPSAWHFLAHVLLLQDLLGMESISAGAWYVAIDLQLFALMVLLLRIARRTGGRVQDAWAAAGTAAGVVLSLYAFSRQVALDDWAVYFLWAYGLGALVHWARQDRRARACLGLAAALVLLDGLLEPRIRPVVALLTAAILYRMPQRSWTGPALTRAVQRLSQLSYGVFVSHFVVILAASGLWHLLGLRGLPAAVAALLLTGVGVLLTGAGVQALGDRATRRLQAWWPDPTTAPARA